MQRAFDQFKVNMSYVKELDALYVHLKETLHLPNDLTDILRAEIVYSISALDKLIHELVRIGMISSLNGTRIKTAKFLTFSVSANTYTSSLISTIPPAEYWFEQEIIQRHKHLAFQAPDKIADALSLIWEESHKWQIIAHVIGISAHDLVIKLKTIVNRRNQIVHESDLDLITGTRTSLNKAETDEVVLFVEELSTAIFNAVK